MNENTTLVEIFNLAIKNHQANKLEEAQDLYNQVLKIDPDHLRALNNIGTIFLNLGENQKAKECFEKAIKINPNHATGYNSLGIILHKFRELQNSITCYEKAIEIDPNYSNAYNNLGAVFKELKEYKKAASCYEKVIEIDPKYIKAHNNLGVVFFELGDNLKAKDCYEKAIEINPNYSNAHNNLGIVFKASREISKAINCYEKAIETNPNKIDAHVNLGVAFYELGNLQKAISCYEKAIEINPNLPNAYNNLGNIFQNLGEYQKAVKYYEKAIEINPNFPNALNNLGVLFFELGDNLKAKDCYEKALKIEPDNINILTNYSTNLVSSLNDLNKATNSSYKVLKIYHEKSQFNNQNISLFRLKHDVQQAEYLSLKNHKIDGIDEFQKVGDEILSRKENKKAEDDLGKKILLTPDEINSLLPFYKADLVYQTKKISGSCINPNKNWLDVEDEYLNSSNQIMHIDDFLSEEALIELREFCLVSKVWNKEYNNKYLGAFSDAGFISPIHLQIAIDLKEKLPKLFGPHRLGKFWGFKYDSTLGKGINIHADFAIHNLNFWITPDEYNNKKDRGGLKVYDAPAPDNWTFRDYNKNSDKIYKFLKDNNSNCTNVPYKFNRAVLFNSAYFHETDEIDFKDEYKGRRINNTYLFGGRLVNKNR